MLFASSAFLVTYIRSVSYIESVADVDTSSSVSLALESKTENLPQDPLSVTVAGVGSLLVDRWVGMEGVMAVSSYPQLGWDVWRYAWAEVYDENSLSFYDKNLIESAYKNTDTSKFHFVSLSGIIAFFFILDLTFFCLQLCCCLAYVLR